MADYNFIISHVIIFLDDKVYKKICITYFSTKPYNL